MKDAAVFGHQEPKLFDFDKEGFAFEAFRDHLYKVLDAECQDTQFQRACMKERLYREIENLKTYHVPIFAFPNVSLRDATILFDPMVKSCYPRKNYCIQWHLADGSRSQYLGRKYRYMAGDLTYLGNIKNYDVYLSNYGLEPAKLMFKYGEEMTDYKAWNPYEEQGPENKTTFFMEAYKRARALGYFLDLPEDIFGRPDFQETQPL